MFWQGPGPMDDDFPFQYLMSLVIFEVPAVNSPGWFCVSNSAGCETSSTIHRDTCSFWTMELVLSCGIFHCSWRTSSHFKGDWNIKLDSLLKAVLFLNGRGTKILISKHLKRHLLAGFPNQVTKPSDREPVFSRGKPPRPRLTTVLTQRPPFKAWRSTGRTGRPATTWNHWRCVNEDFSKMVWRPRPHRMSLKRRFGGLGIQFLFGPITSKQAQKKKSSMWITEIFHPPEWFTPKILRADLGVESLPSNREGGQPKQNFTY